MTAYVLATLNRMLGISSMASLSSIGRMFFAMTSRLTTDARVCPPKPKLVSGPVRCLGKGASTYGDGKACCHPVEVVGVVAHGHNFGNYGFARPLNPKDLRKLLEVACGGLADGEDGVAQPAHAQRG